VKDEGKGMEAEGWCWRKIEGGMERIKRVI
jgi:hypothetical protein